MCFGEESQVVAVERRSDITLAGEHIRKQANMSPYEWTVIGAGPAGIATIGRLLDAGIPGERIAWIDPHFAVGDFGGKWRAVPGNTAAATFVEFLTASPSFQFAEAPSAELLSIDPQETCALGVVADVLEWVTGRLSGRVHTYRTIATELTLSERRWSLQTSDGLIVSLNAVLATGADPKSLHRTAVSEIPLESVLDPCKLSHIPLDGATVAVFGSSHSAMIALPNLLGSSAKRVVNFYRSPLRYAVNLGDWTLFDDSGLKGRAAQWARENVDGTWPDRLHRCSVDAPEYSDAWSGCDRVVYTVGFQRRPLPVTPQWGFLDYDASSGILAPGLFGIGIGFPGAVTNRLGAVEYRVGLAKFMRRLDCVLPLWLRYEA